MNHGLQNINVSYAGRMAQVLIEWKETLLRMSARDSKTIELSRGTYIRTIRCTLTWKTYTTIMCERRWQA